MEKNILPLCCFPPVHWMRIAMQHDSALNLEENYVKQSYRNRFDILGVNGPITITIPVQGQKGEKIPSNEIRIADDNWRGPALRSIKSAYGRAAFFEYYITEIEAIILGKQELLVDFNTEALQFIMKKMKGIELFRESDFAQIRAQSEERVNVEFEPSTQWAALTTYPQVFSDRFAFVSNLSMMDVLMNLGPRSLDYLYSLK